MRQNFPVRDNYGKLLPGLKLSELSGKLIVIEGTDGAGRTTQIDLLRPWLEEMGHAVLDTGMARSSLAGDGIRRAKEGNNLGRVTQSLFYATDLVDRLENEIIPALRAGFVVLTDRYIYSLMARALVRGVDPQWVRKLYRMALKPDAVFYLRLGVEQLVPRVVFSRGFDYWESGMDFSPARDMYEGFCNYQKALLAEFDRLSAEYNFEVVDASADAKTVFGVLQARISRLLQAPQKQEGTVAPVAAGPAAGPCYVRLSESFDAHAGDAHTSDAHPGDATAQSAARAALARSEADAEFEWLLVLASQLAAARDRVFLDPPPPPPKREAVFELQLTSIAAQIDEAFALARQSLAAGAALGKSVGAPLSGNGHTNHGPNGHGGGNGNGHANGHHLPQP